MGTLFLRRLSRWQAETERDHIADLYAAAHRDPSPDAAPPDRAGFLRRFVDHDVQRPEFDLMLAGDPEPVGCAYGFLAEREDGWWDRFRQRPEALPTLAEHRRIFVVTELLVHPRRRGEGLAGRLQRELLSRVSASAALLLVEAGDGPAQSALPSLGWGKAGELTPRDGAALAAWTTPLG
ncbi:hypothetical protein [Streptomyces sedi]|uniref:GNAT family N-acetyltransferase n=1 Tax=Streptomyces sedi TaxID=555059 RepID=A0A5C4VAR2_9ACTN|nr:hypothetical protein [Streptomyces sedi]TNM32957.1 hypothetical protein FH715_06570 [Streptomyces sedi]